MAEEDQIEVLTAGIDIGSSTSHLVFSRIVLERLDSRYVIASRETLYESEILLTPYTRGETIDAAALGLFIDRQYRNAGIDPEKIDTGALVLTGVAVEKSNARAIGELFARQAGKMVAVTAGDRLEAIMACYGSGAVARSLREPGAILNIDIGGGTTKIGLCVQGRVASQAALDAGARLICVDEQGRVDRIEAAGRRYAAEAGFQVDIGGELDVSRRRALSGLMADRIMAAVRGRSPIANGVGLLRTEPLQAMTTRRVIISGGVAEYFYGREQKSFGDIGPDIAAALRTRLEAEGLEIEHPDQAIRATVVGASQYTTQVSGSTIYISPMSLLPLRNVPVIAVGLGIECESIDSSQVIAAIRSARVRLDLTGADRPVAIFAPWRGSATFDRLDAFCRGIAEALKDITDRGHPIILAGDGDVGGLIGAHFRHELNLDCPIVSIDSLDLREFDYVDIGEMLEYSGAVPVVIKSLIFPGRHS